MGMTVEQIAENSGASVLSVCRTLLRLIDKGLVKPAGDVDEAKTDLRRRMNAELSR